MNEAMIEELNKAASDEIRASLQYMYFHFRLEDMGYKPLASLFRRVAIMEMAHIEHAAERILFLNGEVSMKLTGGIEHIHTVKEMLIHARDMEHQAIADYNAAIKKANEVGDAVSREVFESLLRDEEGHFDEFDNQVTHIEEHGETYLALQVFEEEPAPELKHED